MKVIARFTPTDLDYEIPFGVLEENGKYFLYGEINLNHEKRTYKKELSNDNGLLSLTKNPFQEEDSIVSERLTGLSNEWLEGRSQGFDNSIDTIESQQPGYGPDDIFVENKPFSLRQISDLIKEGDIELTPDFQRNFIWDKTRQSRLIESILLGLPLPSIYLSQYKDGRLTVVDGLQRLSTIKSFLDNKLVLSNLEYLEECNGKKFNQLEGVLSQLRTRRFTQTQLMCYVIDYRSPSKLKFDLFRRLNTGGKPLNSQEIRNCLSRPTLQKVLKEMVTQDSFIKATDGSVKDARMDARDAALRFMFFYKLMYEKDGIDSYNGFMDGSLNDFVDECNDRPYEDLKSYISYYNDGLLNSFHLFGEYTFRKVTSESIESRRSPVNKLLMLSFTVLLCKIPNEKVVKSVNYQDLLPPLAHLIENDEELFRAITYGTNSKWNVKYSINTFHSFLTEHLPNYE